MESSNWQQIKTLFYAVLDAPEDERAAILASIDSTVRSEIEKLLRANDEAEDFIVEPAFLEAGFTDAGETDSYLGKQIDSYQILAEIGRGGMGTVYLAAHGEESFNKKVAIKLIKRGMDTTAVLKRFIMERKILAQLENPNIASLLDGGSTTDGLPYLVMEYIEGEPITKFCDSHQYDIEERLELFRKVCSAVSYAHQNLIVHRDLKPSNILVSKDGTPKLLDFGIAKLLHPDWSAETDEATATMFRLMTPEYASPEQIRGLPITTASDVYSLGVVLYELLSGQRPYKIERPPPPEIAKTAEPVRPSSVVSSRSSFVNKTKEQQPPQTNPGSQIVNAKLLRGDLDNIILKALRKEPERRYLTVQEFSEDIRRHLAGLPVTATADTTFYLVGKFIKRHRAGVFAGLFMFLSLLAGISVAIWQAVEARKERAKAEQRFNEVRQLANSLVFEFHDSIQNLPGSTPFRELLVGRALEYLDKLAAEAGQDRSLQFELADAYDKIGDIQGGFGTSHLGQRQKASESYRKAMNIREALVAAEPNNAELRRKLSVSYTKFGDTLWIEVDPNGALDAYGKALEINKNLSADLPNDKQIRWELALAYGKFGYLHGANGHTDEALENTRQAVILMEELAASDPNNVKIQGDLALSYDRVAEMLTGLTENHEEALSLFLKSQKIGEKLAAADSLNTKLRRGQAVGDYNVALVSAKLGDTKTALDNSRHALSIIKDLLAADPQNDEFRQAEAMFQTFVGEMMIKNGEAGEAIKLLKQSLLNLEKSFAASPTDEIAHFRIAVTLAALGHANLALASDNATARQTRLPFWREARSWLQKSREIFKIFNDDGKLIGEDAARFETVNTGINQCDQAIIQLAKP
jgi:serine/threonine protein kinase/tetratricopeptide (TPR) repeat protein